MRHCAPSSLVSGLGSLPVDYVYVDGVQTNERTTKKLPTGEPLSGKEGYTKILSYFTTNEMTPEEIHELGYQQLNILYPEVSCTSLSPAHTRAICLRQSSFVQRALRKNLPCARNFGKVFGTNEQNLTKFCALQNTVRWQRLRSDLRDRSLFTGNTGLQKKHTGLYGNFQHLLYA